MFIYAIGSDANQKIGFSSNVEQRLTTLQTGNPERLRVHHKIEIEGGEGRARLVERMIHKQYSHKRVNGEWFSMTPKEATNALVFAEIAWVDDPLLEWKL
jgi:hypothetical protein